MQLGLRNQHVTNFVRYCCFHLEACIYQRDYDPVWVASFRPACASPQLAASDSRELHRTRARLDNNRQQTSQRLVPLTSLRRQQLARRFDRSIQTARGRRDPPTSLWSWRHSARRAPVAVGLVGQARQLHDDVTDVTDGMAGAQPHGRNKRKSNW